MTPKFAEFLGILAGDGYIQFNRKKNHYIVEEEIGGD